MMCSRGKELPTSVVESKGQVIVVSDPVLQQAPSGNEYVTTTHAVPTPQPQDLLSSNNHGVHVNRALRTQLPLAGSHTTPIASMMEEMQGRFAQLDRTQRSQLLEWMMSNLDGGDLVSRIQSQPPLTAPPVQTVISSLPPQPQVTQQVQSQPVQQQQVHQPQPQQPQQITSPSQPQQQSLTSYPRSEPSQGYPTTISQLPWSATKIEGMPAGAEVLGVAVPGMNFETSSITTGATINYVPLVASHSTSGVTYATPVYNNELPTASGDQGTYQVSRQPQPSISGLPQGARVIAEATITNNRDANIIIPGSSTVSTSLASQILDTANIVSVTNAMMVAEGADADTVTLHQAATSEANVDASNVQPLIVIKHLDQNVMIEGSTITNEDAAAAATVANSAMISGSGDSKAGITLAQLNAKPEKTEKEAEDPDKGAQPVVRSHSGFRGKKRKQRRRSPCAECKKYFHLVLDETKKTRIWREKNHVCPTCNKIFRTRAHLKVHERIHTGVKPYICSICNKGFAQSSAAKAHTLLHAMPKPFVCPVCGKAVTTKGNLKLHMALHSGARPFTCPHCQKTFPRKSNLDQHVLVHTGEKPYGCQFCGKKFRTVTSRTTHERIHTGEKPFTCKYCGKAFSDKRNLTSHEKIHTGGYPCTTCGKHFSDRRRLKSHQCTGQQAHLAQM